MITDLESAARSRDRLQHSGLLVPQALSVPAVVSLASAARQTLLSTELPHGPKATQVAVMALLQPKLRGRQTSAIPPCRGSDL